MQTRNFKKNPLLIPFPIFKKKTEREKDEEKEPSINPETGRKFDYVWAMSIIGEECGNPLISKCPSRKFKGRVPCVLSKVNGLVFHFPRCYLFSSLTLEELERKKRKKSENAKVRVQKISNKRLA